MDGISETRLTLINPVMAVRAHSLYAYLGFELRVTQGLRNSNEQTALWSQGRLGLVEVNALRAKIGWAPLSPVDNERTVTNAPSGHSWHEYGLAFDFVPMSPLPDWNESHPTWQKVISSCRSFSLLDGISFHDGPHLQAWEIPVSPTPLYLNTLKSDGLEGVWKLAGLV